MRPDICYEVLAFIHPHGSRYGGTKLIADSGIEDEDHAWMIGSGYGGPDEIEQLKADGASVEKVIVMSLETYQRLWCKAHPRISG